MTTADTTEIDARALRPDQLDPTQLHPGLPAPGRTRWQPLRLGLVELFHYDTEELWFRDGHLLLRGNNGTGKSKVLALTLPFLLDGDTRPQRVEPDGDPNKRMDWNLLLGGAHDDRLGYTWLELGRVDEDGRAHTLTLGCGLKAVAGRGVVDHWFFGTQRRIGADLHLVDRNGYVLPKDRLREALADRGTIYATATSYRRAVDEALFGLGAERYDALVSLLVQLRQPQLSKRPDEAALSRALTQALPPIGQEIVADVAAAMRTIDDDRADLARLAEARAAVGLFAERYQRYATVATVRRETALRTSTSAYERTGRQLAEAQQARETADGQLTALRAEREQSQAERRRLDALERSLDDSEAMRDARRLRDLEQRAEEAQQAAADALGLQQEATQLARRRRREASEAAAAADAGRERRDRDAARTAEAADAAGVGSGHADVVAVLDRDADLPAAREACSRIAEARIGAVAHLRERVRVVEAAARERGRHRQLLDEATSDRDRAAEVRAEAHGDLAQTRGVYLSSVTDHLAALTVVVGDDVDDAIVRLTEWADEPAGENPMRTWLDARARDSAAVLGGRLAQVQTATDLLADERGAAADEAARLRAGSQPVPPPVPTRPSTQRAGAPLWQVVDFVDHVQPAQRAGIEAALQAAGLLDALITPDGGLLDPDTLDVAVTVGAPVASPLSDVLRPADAQLAVPAEVVARALAGIGLGAATADTWVAVDGRFRLGVAEGAWRKETAQFIGHAAREEARRRRLAELDDVLISLDARLQELAGEAERLRADLDTAAREAATLPTDEQLRSAVAAVVAAEDALGQREQRRVAARDRLDAAEASLAEATAERDLAAADLDLPTTSEALDRVAEAVTGYRLAAQQLWSTSERLGELVAASERAGREQRDAEVAFAGRSDAAVAAQRAAAAAADERDALRQTAGIAVAEIEARLAEVAAQRDRLDLRLAALGEQVDRVTTAVGQATGRAEVLAEQQESRDAQRRHDADALRRLAAVGAVAAAAPDLQLPDVEATWAPVPAVQVARRLHDRLGDVDASDAAWDRASTAITSSLADLQRVLVAQSASAVADMREDVLVVTVRYRSQATTPRELAVRLDEQIADRQRLLGEREREILENHLVSEVASHLSALISEAESQVERVNAELRSRPTTTGMVLRFRWVPDTDGGPTGLAEARQRLLRQAAVMWSPQDRAAVGAFLQAEIARQRAADETATWFEHLSRAFDYRSWHRFVIERRAGDGAWRRATGPASGGERALAVTLPLFAAASAHYSTARDTAPRLVLLDEAFAGVDDAARRQCMGLLGSFDLDYVLTSEREWGCYPEVPGLSICHLVRRDGIDAVHVSRWEWDGRARTAVERPGDSARQPRPPEDGGPADEALFG